MRGLSKGRGHATQVDGELVGDPLERAAFQATGAPPPPPAAARRVALRQLKGAEQVASMHPCSSAQPLVLRRLELWLCVYAVYGLTPGVSMLRAHLTARLLCRSSAA